MKATPLSCVGNFFTRTFIADVNANAVPATGRCDNKNSSGGQIEDSGVCRRLHCVYEFALLRDSLSREEMKSMCHHTRSFCDRWQTVH